MLSRLLKTALIVLLFFCFQLEISAQVNLTVTVNSGSSTTTCTDGLFGGGPELHWAVQIAGTGYTTYPRRGICYINPPNVQYVQPYACASAYPTTIQICIQAFEDDGTACVPTKSCLEQLCQNFAMPAPGASLTYNLAVTGSSNAGVNFTIQATGSFLDQGNDLICDAIDIGTLNPGDTLGDNTLSSYNNFCAGNTGDPNPWGGNNDQGVWFQFTTGSSVGSVVNLNALSDPQGLGDPIDLQLALFESSNGLCSGALTLIQEDYQGLGLQYDEEMDINCLSPNTTYFLLIDGEEMLISPGGQEGYFGLEISDYGIAQAGDLICDAEDLGLVPNGGSVGTAPLSQSNICATNISDPNPSAWSSNQTVWFQFQAPLSGSVLIDAVSDNPFPIGVDPIDIELAVYESADNTCSGLLSELSSSYTPGLFNEDLTLTCLTPGDNYWIMLDGSASNVSGTFGISVSDAGIPPASNDLICDAVALGTPPIGGTVSATNQNNYCATNTPDPVPSTWANQQGVWYSFIAPSSGVVDINATSASLFGDQIDLQLAVYELAGGVCSGVPTELISQHNGPGLLFDENLTLECLTPNVEYWILVDGEGSIINPDLAEGEFDIEVAGVDQDPPLGNNEVCNAIALGNPTGSPVGTTPGALHGSQNNFCADSVGEPQPSNFVADQTVWYTFVAPSTGSVNIQAFSDPLIGGVDPIDLEIAVYNASSCFGPFQEVISGSDLTYDIDLDVNCLDIGQTYYIQIDGAPPEALGGQEGYFDLTLTEIPPLVLPPNDLICNATNLGNPWAGAVNITTQYNFCAGSIGDSIPLAFPPDQSVWYSFTTPLVGGPFALDVLATSDQPWPFGVDALDLQIAVFESSDNTCTGSLAELNSSYSTVDLFDEFLNVQCLEAGQTYFLMVDGSFLNVEGYFDINLSAATGVPIPTNDNICNQINLGVVPIAGSINDGIDYSNFCADTEPGEPNPFVDGIAQTVWFSFIAPTSGNVTINALSDPNAIGDPVDIQLALWYSDDSTCTGNFLEVGSEYDITDFNESLSVTCLQAGVTYFLQVDGASGLVGGDDGWFTLEIIDDGGSTNFPYNNDICNAFDFGIPSAVQTLFAESNECGNVELGEPGISVYASNTVWYEFIAPISGQIEIQVGSTDIVSGMDPEVYLYSSSNNTCNGTLVLAESSSNPTAPIMEIISTNCLVPGERYFIQVDGEEPNIEGTFNISIEDPSPLYGSGLPGDLEPVNNVCSDAIMLTVQAESCFSGSGIFDQFNYGEPTVSLDASIMPGCGTNCGETWYQFIMPASGSVLIEGNDDNIGGDFSSLNITAYSGACGALSALDCDTGGTTSNPVLSFGSPAGTIIWLQISNEGGVDNNELFELCVSEGCGFDNCLDAVASPMFFDTTYCFNTASATGEIIPAQNGYLDCTDAANPENSQYYYFVTACDTSDVTVSIVNAQINGSCILGITPTNGLTVSIYEDATPCDNNADALLTCQTFTSCDPQPINWTNTFTNLLPNTQYIILLDGGFGVIGGDVTGDIVVSSTAVSIPTSNQAVVGCDSAIVLGNTYLSSTFFNDTIIGGSLNGCDSIVTYNVTINSPDSTFANATSCLPSDTGSIDSLFMNVAGCDSVHTIVTTLLLTDSTFANATSCLPSDTGSMDSLFMNVAGCDSVHTIVTTLLLSDSTFANATSCMPSDTGSMDSLYMNVAGCDSVHTIVTSLLLSDSTFANATSCNPADTGVISVTNSNQFTCDSVHTVTTTLIPTSFATENITACDSTFAAGSWLFASSSFNDTIIGGANNGCDSITTFNVTINNSDSTFANATSCNPSDTGIASITNANVNACDSVHTITTTLAPFSSATENVTGCDSALVLGSWILSSTSFEDTIVGGAANGCDSITTYNITINNSDSTFANATSCNPADTGVANVTNPNQFACDSVHTITTTLAPFSSATENVTGCDSALVLGSWILSSTSFEDTIVGGAANGCDSITTFNITINNSDSTFANATSCNPADTGVASVTNPNQFACDSVHTITTSLLPSDSTFANATSCNPLDTGVTSVTNPNQFNCDSVYTITTTLAPFSSATENITGCDSAFVLGSWILSSTSFEDTIVGGAANGCDSITTFNVTINNSDSTFATASSCNPTDTGVASVTNPNLAGCDSTHTITTTLLPSDSTFANATSCNLADTGVASVTNPNQFTCDSVHTVTTTLLPSDSTFANTTSCNPADTGVVSLTNPNQFTCDSVHTITTTLAPFSSATENITGCDSALVLGSWILSSTSFEDSIVGGAANGCDSITTFNVTINNSDSTFANATSCNPADTGVASVTNPNQFTCDSVYTITTTLAPFSSATENITACDSTFAAGSWLFASSSFNDTIIGGANNGCDSITTFNVTINSSDSTFANATSCNPADTGVVSVNNPNQFTCDSVHTITTTLAPFSSATENITACDSTFAAGSWLFASSSFNDTIIGGANNGCDSITTFNVTINSSDSTFANATSCNPADTGVVSVTNPNQFTCDSVHTITTTLLPSDSTFANATSCNLADTGVVSVSIPNQFTCDSVHTVTTTLLQSDSTFANATSCNPADTGVVSVTNPNQFACDSVHTITTTLAPFSSATENITGCDSALVLGNWILSSTSFEDTIIGGAANGCDSITTFNITINNSDSTFANATSCNPADTGVANVSNPNQFACDSVHTVTTTLLQSDSTFANTTSCNPADTGVVSLTNPNQFTCDSVHTVTTTLLQSDSTFANATSCNPADTGIVSVTNANQFLCDSVHTVTTFLDSSIAFWSNTPDINVCNGFNVSFEVQASDFTTYQWYIDSTGVVELLNESQIYQGTQTSELDVNILQLSMNGQRFVLEMTDNCGDIIYDSIQLNVFEPVPLQQTVNDFEVCVEVDTVVFFDYVSSNATWSNGDFGQFLEPEESGLYIVNFIEDSTNCLYADSINISILNCVDDCDLFLPTAFSPGVSIGMNDLFKVLTNCSEGFSSFEFQIVNRWGELVYLSTNPLEGWDGTYKDNQVGVGVYSYFIKYTKNVTGESGELKGNVTVIK